MSECAGSYSQDHNKLKTDILTNGKRCGDWLRPQVSKVEEQVNQSGGGLGK